jgi:hypothetical protein
MILKFNEFINEKKEEKWIQDIEMKKGGLKKMLGYGKDEDIPDGIIEEIIKEKVGSEIEVKGEKIKITPLMKKRANLARTLKKI